MSGGNEPETGSHGTLVWAIRTTGIAAFVGLAATQYFARGSHPVPGQTQVAQASAGRSSADPETTGSIARGVRLARLDPCGTPSGTRTPRP